MIDLDKIIDKYNNSLVRHEYESVLNWDRSHLKLVHDYISGKHPDPYTPSYIRQEFRQIAQVSKTNWLSLILDTFVKSLSVNGYYHTDDGKSADGWEYWQANQLDAKQSIIHRSTLAYGHAYVTVMPGIEHPTIECYSPMDCYAWYSLLDDEFPQAIIIYKGQTDDGSKLYEFIDEERHIKYLVGHSVNETGNVTTYNQWLNKQKDKKIIYDKPHNLGFVPVVKFQESYINKYGILFQLIPTQQRINDTCFSISTAIQFASFRQKIIAGMKLRCPKKGHGFTDGKGICEKEGCTKFESPIELGANKLILLQDADAKWGEFSQTNTQDMQNAILHDVESLAAISQIPVHVLLGKLNNLSAEALGASEAPMIRKLKEYENIFGEGWEKVLKIGLKISGHSNTDNHNAQIRWRDSETRSLSQIADALIKLKSIGVPEEILFKFIPGLTQTDISQMIEIVKSNRKDEQNFSELLKPDKKEEQEPILDAKIVDE